MHARGWAQIKTAVHFEQYINIAKVQSIKLPTAGLAAAA